MSYWRISMVIAALLASLGLGAPSSTTTSSTSVAGRFNQSFDVGNNSQELPPRQRTFQCAICN